MHPAYIPLSSGLEWRGVSVVWPMRCISPATIGRARQNASGPAISRNLEFIGNKVAHAGFRAISPSFCLFGRVQMFVAFVEFCARLFLTPAIMLPKFFRVVIKLFGNLAADGPGFFQRFIMFRFHHFSPAIPAV